MYKLEGYEAGVNLGGWISQYHTYDKEHFDAFITESDIKQIAKWGMDHIRLPIDYPVLEDDSEPFVYKEDGFDYVSKCIGWCKKYGLNAVLDLHKAPGYSFGTLKENTLFSDEQMQKRFIELWKEFARRYLEERDTMVFELLNEVVEPNSERWNKLSREVVEAIRDVDKERKIMVGSNRYNSVKTLQELEVLDDPNVLYTFHFYEPFLFTHQKASWSEMPAKYNTTVDYPGKCPGIKEFLDQNPKYKPGYERFVDLIMDKEYLRRVLQPAVEFIEKTGKPLYCGEYGVIQFAPLESRVNWHRDFVSLLKEYQMGKAMWNYKRGFGLVDRENNVISQELIDIVADR